jgi:hypothetical protein
MIFVAESAWEIRAATAGNNRRRLQETAGSDRLALFGPWQALVCQDMLTTGVGVAGSSCATRESRGTRPRRCWIGCARTLSSSGGRPSSSVSSSRQPAARERLGSRSPMRLECRARARSSASAGVASLAETFSAAALFGPLKEGRCCDCCQRSTSRARRGVCVAVRGAGVRRSSRMASVSVAPSAMRRSLSVPVAGGRRSGLRSSVGSRVLSRPSRSSTSRHCRRIWPRNTKPGCARARLAAASAAL